MIKKRDESLLGMKEIKIKVNILVHYKENEEMKILVARKKGRKRNKIKKQLLKSKPVFVEQEQDFGFEEIQEKNEKQIKLLKAWEK